MLTVSRGRIDGEYHHEKEYDVAVVGINGAQKNFVCTNKGVLYDTSTNYRRNSVKKISFYYYDDFVFGKHVYQLCKRKYHRKVYQQDRKTPIFDICVAVFYSGYHCFCRCGGKYVSGI